MFPEPPRKVGGKSGRDPPAHLSRLFICSDQTCEYIISAKTSLSPCVVTQCGRRGFFPHFPAFFIFFLPPLRSNMAARVRTYHRRGILSIISKSHTSANNAYLAFKAFQIFSWKLYQGTPFFKNFERTSFRS